MERLRRLLRQREFHVLLFCLVGVTWSWPFVRFSNLARLENMFHYLFFTWGLAVFLLFLVSLSLKKPGGRDDLDDED